MGLAFTDIADAVLLTQEELIRRGAWVDAQTSLQNHVFTRRLWKDGKLQKKFQGGHPWEWPIQVDHNYSARAVGLYQTDASAINDTMVMASVQPRHVNAHYTYDLREKAFNRGATAIADHIKTKYVACMVSLFEYLESVLSSKPDDSTDKLTPYGLTYWVVKNATEGFYGADPSGFSGGRAGVPTSTYSRLANYSGTYTEVNDEDLLPTMSRMVRKIDFRPVVVHSTPEVGGMSKAWFTNDTLYGKLEQLLRASNMNLGTDLGRYNGMASYNSVPIEWASKLDSDTDNPIYALNFDCLALGVLDGWQERWTPPYMVPGSHTVQRVDVDLTCQMICTDVRRQGVLYEA